MICSGYMLHGDCMVTIDESECRHRKDSTHQMMSDDGAIGKWWWWWLEQWWWGYLVPSCRLARRHFSLLLSIHIISIASAIRAGGGASYALRAPSAIWTTERRLGMRLRLQMNDKSWRIIMMMILVMVMTNNFDEYNRNYYYSQEDYSCEDFNGRSHHDFFDINGN